MAAIVAVPLLPAHAQRASPSEIPSLFGSPMAARNIPSGSTVLAYPYPDVPVFPFRTTGFSYSSRYQSVNDALLDQAVSGMRFKLIGGYGGGPKVSLIQLVPRCSSPCQ
jgi:hypothetical protein